MHWLQRNCLTLNFVLLSLGAATPTFASTATVSIGDATRGTSNVPVTMQFPVSLFGDHGAVLHYRTIDGTALAGTDYIAASGNSVVSPVQIPVTLSPNVSSTPDRAFQFVVDRAAGVGPSANFAPYTTSATGAYPISIAVADMNGDGRPDLIVLDKNKYSQSVVSVQLSNTAPGSKQAGFTNRQELGAGVQSVAVADINGDGKPDIIVLSGGVSVFLNTTTPGATTITTASPQTFATGVASTSVIAADINEDGKPDLIVTNSHDHTVSVLINTTSPGASTPTFSAQQVFATGAEPIAVVATDINGDGKVDLIVANDVDNTVSILLNTTSPGALAPSFAAQQTFATGVGPTSVTAADINGDGIPDLVVANRTDNTISVLLNTTTPGSFSPTLAPSATFPTGSSPGQSLNSVAAIDVNGDGKPDLIVADFKTVSVLINTSTTFTASFTSPQNFAAGSGPSSVVVADINGDGNPDLLAVNNYANTVSALINIDTPVARLDFAVQQTFPTGMGPASVAAADINGDGKPDLLVANTTDGTVSVLLNTTPSGTPVASFAAQQSFATGAGPTAVIAADINGDGKPDLIVANGTDNTVSVLLNTTTTGAATPTFSAQQAFATGTNPRAVVAADINGDGKLDLIVANWHSNTVSVLLNTTTAGGSTPSFASQQTFAAGSFPNSVTAGDLNGDGKPDLAVGSSGNTQVSVLLNTTTSGSMTPTFATQQAFNAGTYAGSVGIVDVNGDGMPDILASWSVLLNASAPGDTTLQFAPPKLFATKPGNGVAKYVDLDGDGKLDLVTPNEYDNSVSVRLNTSIIDLLGPQTNFGPTQTFTTGVSPVSVTTADINGDGKPDLIVVNQADNNISVLINSQYQCLITRSPATGTIVHDYIFANEFQ